MCFFCVVHIDLCRTQWDKNKVYVPLLLSMFFSLPFLRNQCSHHRKQILIQKNRKYSVDIGILQSIILEIPRTITVDIGTFPICSCLSYLIFSNVYIHIYTSFFFFCHYLRQSHQSHHLSSSFFLLYRTYFSSLIYTCVSCCTINRTHTSHLPNLHTECQEERKKQCVFLCSPY